MAERQLCGQLCDPSEQPDHSVPANVSHNTYLKVTARVGEVR